MDSLGSGFSDLQPMTQGAVMTEHGSAEETMFWTQQPVRPPVDQQVQSSCAVQRGLCGQRNRITGNIGAASVL